MNAQIKTAGCSCGHCKMHTPEPVRKAMAFAHYESTLASIAKTLASLAKSAAEVADFHLIDQEESLTDLIDALDRERTRLLSARDTAAELAEGVL